MPLISEEDRQTLQDLFKGLENDMTITYFTQHDSPLVVPSHECQYCKETREILEEVSSLSGKIHLEIKDFLRDEQEAQKLGITHIPAFILQGQAKGNVRFFGIPAGYEFATLVEDIIDVSKGTTELSEQTQKELKGINQDLHIQVFVTPT
jgi:glutaredoxin-like protein